jgi:hypothetical protein
MLHLIWLVQAHRPQKEKLRCTRAKRNQPLASNLGTLHKVIEVHFPVPQMHQESFSLQNVSRQQITNQRESEISSKRKIIEQQRMKPVSDLQNKENQV